MSTEEQKPVDDNIKNQGVAIFKSVLANKADITAEQVVTNLLEGNADPVYVSIVLKKFAKIQEIVFKNADIKDMTVAEISKHFGKTGKTANLYGAKITVASGGFWDYSTTDDPYLEKLQEIAEQVKDLIKARTDELEAKAKIWHKQNTENPTPGSFGVTSFNITVERLPRLEWDDQIDVIETNPPTKRGADQLRFTV